MKYFFVAFLFLSLCITGKSQSIQSVKIEELVKIYEAAKGPTVVNFWSTWCKPCIEEIPHFSAVVDSMKKVQLMLVSLDTKELYETSKLKTFIGAQGWKANFYWLNETNADRYCPPVDSTWSGVIPVTLIINPAKHYKKFYEKALNKTELLAAIKASL